jgi:UDP-N-acetylglucosamine 2-epimerase (non-hydrolysing)
MARRPLVAHVVGARPNYMKVAPVYAELERRGRVEQRLIHTGQHYDAIMKDVFFAELPLPHPHVELHIGSGSPGGQTGRALIELERVFLELKPDLVVVAGDVNSTLSGALAAVKVEVAVCHIEAGLRSFEWDLPEEHNRRITDHLSTLLLTHSDEANENLAAEGIPSQDQHVDLVGNTMIDTLLANIDAARAVEAWRDFGVEPRGYVLVTLHRQRLFTAPGLLERTLNALDVLSGSLPVVFPLHPRTRAALEANGLLARSKVLFADPLPYRRFLSLQADAAAVITDSGGVPEETTVLGVPCYTLRDHTDRPVTVRLGTNTVIGQDPAGIESVPTLLDDQRDTQIPPFWDGRAGERAADAVERLLALVEVPA